MTKVFISYSHKDEAWKDHLKTHLAVLEHQNLLSVWDDRQIAAGDDWYPEIEQAIESAQIAILLISAEFLSSKFILGKEIPPLLERRREEDLRVIPLILKPCSWQTVSWLTKIQGRPLDNRPLSGFDEHHRDYHLSQLALEINELLTKIPSSIQPNISANTIAPLQTPKVNYDPRNPAFLVPFRAKGKYMVGRDAALEKVRQQLLAGKPTSIGQTALFQGIGGLGKTQLAVEYAYHYRDAYPNGVYWITADENIDAQLTQIAVTANWVAPVSEHAVKLDVARNRLRTYSDCLVVFDNLESVEAIRDYLPDASANPHILVTSRREQVEFADVELDLLNDEQSYSMLVQEAGKAPENEAEKSAAHEIVAALNGLPLALELAGAYLARRRIGWCAYRDLLLDDLKQALPKKLASPTQHEADLFNTLRISEQGIEEEPLLIQVLDLLTWSGSSPMGLPLMAHLLGVKEVELVGALGLGKALRLLQEVSDNKCYAIHRLVQEVRRQDHPLDEHKDWVNTITQRLGEWFEAIRNDFHALPMYEVEFEHLRAWQNHAGFISPAVSVRLLWLQAHPALHRARYDDACHIVKQALETYGIHGLGDQRLNAQLLTDLANCHAALGNYTQALALGIEVLEMRRELLGNRHPVVATSLGNVASYYSQLGNFSRALELGNEALELMRGALQSDKSPGVVTLLNNLAEYYSNLGDYTRALELGTEALEMRRELQSDKHPGVATSLNNLANFHAHLGNHARALELGTEALKMREELLGDKHPAVATSLGNLASYYLYLGDDTRALEFGIKALKMRQELLGDKHPDVAISLGNLAKYYSDLGEHARALELGKETLEMRYELLGESHHDTIDSLLFALKRLYANPRTTSQGMALAERFLKRIPREHSSYMRIMNFLNERKGFRKPGKNEVYKKKKKK